MRPMRPMRSMRHTSKGWTRGVAATAATAGTVVVALLGGVAGASADDEAPAFSDPTTIDNPYLPLSKFSRCTLRGEEDGSRQRIVRKVLDRTRTFVVDGVAVETLVVKDRVKEEGKLIEDTRDFFAQDDQGNVRYFGEAVDNIRNGHVVDHHGSWLFGRDTQVIGVLMHADPHVGRHWKSEDAPRSPSSTTAWSRRSRGSRFTARPTARSSTSVSTRCPTRRSSTSSTPGASA